MVADLLLMAVLLLAFGPLAVMATLYLVALVLWAAGRPDFLRTLVERRKAAGAAKRTEKDRER